MSGIDSIVDQMIFWIVTFLPKYHYFYLSWQGRHKFYPIIVNFVTNSTNCKSNFFHLWTHQSYPRCENKHLSIFVNIFILYYELCKNVLFPMALILSINQGDKTEKNIKTTPSPPFPSLPPHNHCEKQGIWSAKYPSNLPWQS